MNKRPRILIVDDDHDMLDLLEIVLYKKYEIVAASNGFEALASSKDKPPALVVSDIMMPVMDGFKLLSNLRGNAATKEIPVVAITAFSGQHPVKSLISMGFNGVITKPPDTTAVVALISRLLAPGGQV
ncbi:MAG: response regulator [Chitinispirillaceae bacterium]|jgi:CheY-like chemotaxis protein